MGDTVSWSRAASALVGAFFQCRIGVMSDLCCDLSEAIVRSSEVTHMSAMASGCIDKAGPKVVLDGQSPLVGACVNSPDAVIWALCMRQGPNVSWGRKARHLSLRYPVTISISAMQMQEIVIGAIEVPGNHAHRKMNKLAC